MDLIHFLCYGWYHRWRCLVFADMQLHIYIDECVWVCVSVWIQLITNCTTICDTTPKNQTTELITKGVRAWRSLICFLWIIHIFCRKFPNERAIGIFSSGWHLVSDNRISSHTNTYSHTNRFKSVVLCVMYRCAGMFLFAYLYFFITIFRIICRYRIIDINFEFGCARKAPQIWCHFLSQWWSSFARIPIAFI